MSLQPFPGFTTYPTRHCVTGSLKHVYDFHGFQISEEMLLGLGRGLGFTYMHIKGLHPFYQGRANYAGFSGEGLAITAGRRTGVVTEAHVTSSPRKAEQALVALLRAGQPVMMNVDSGFLPYVDYPPGYHFGGYIVLAAGYDAETGQVCIADRERVPHPVDWDLLEQARGSTFQPFPPKHRWYTFDFTGARPPTAHEVRTAIGEVCEGMLRSHAPDAGINGIRKAIRETLKWPHKLDPEALRQACFNTALFIQARGGTGGGIFRYMYARFLREAAEITVEPRLMGMAAELKAIGDHWEEVASAFEKSSDAPEPADLLADATRPMHGILQHERDFWERLERVVASQR